MIKIYEVTSSPITAQKHFLSFFYFLDKFFLNHLNANNINNFSLAPSTQISVILHGWKFQILILLKLELGISFNFINKLSKFSTCFTLILFFYLSLLLSLSSVFLLFFPYISNLVLIPVNIVNALMVTTKSICHDFQNCKISSDYRLESTVCLYSKNAF